MASDIDRLVADLKPVRRLSPAGGFLIVGLATLAAVGATALGFGLRPDVAALRPAEIVLLRSGALLLIGLATAAAVIASARPGVGARQEGWRWALAAGALFPATSLLLSLGGSGFPAYVLTAESVPYCLGISLTSALVIGAGLIGWLRCGAVTELARAGWLTGLAAGAFGTFAYNLYCPSMTVHYAAIWYVVTVGASAALGRLIVPRLLRW